MTVPQPAHLHTMYSGWFDAQSVLAGYASRGSATCALTGGMSSMLISIYDSPKPAHLQTIYAGCFDALQCFQDMLDASGGSSGLPIRQQPFSARSDGAASAALPNGDSTATHAKTGTISGRANQDRESFCRVTPLNCEE